MDVDLSDAVKIKKDFAILSPKDIKFHCSQPFAKNFVTAGYSETFLLYNGTNVPIISWRW